MPKGRKVVGSRWMQTTYKGDGHGNCLKTKSRVVAKGFTQVKYVDYHETTTQTSFEITTPNAIFNLISLQNITVP